MEKKYEIIDKIIEYGIYIYIIFIFLTKGESIRNILIFGNFGLWLFTLKYRKNLYLLKDPVSISCWIFLGVSIFSVLFSIDPSYSFFALRKEALKVALLFPVITTVMADEVKLKRVAYVSFFTLLLVVFVGYYSYLAHDIQVLRHDILLMDTGETGHNKSARYFNILLPSAFILFFLWKKRGLKILLTFLLIISVIALILTTSREGYLAFFGIVFTWTIYLARTKGYNPIKALSFMAAIFLILGILSWFSSSGVRERISLTTEQLSTLNERTEIWVPAIYAFRQKPFFGWGYGKRIFYQDEPYKETPFKKAPTKGPHNTFLRILFLQGIIGFIPYAFLLLFAIKSFWHKALKTTGIRSYILVACVSVLIGNYIINSMFADMERLSLYLAFMLGLGIAAKGIDENSHN